MEFVARVTKDAGLDLGERNRVYFKHWMQNNPGALIKITPVLPDSNKQRRFYHGAVLPLWAYLDGKEHRSAIVLADLHEAAKLEFNGQLLTVDGKSIKVGRSTKGRELGAYIERVIGHLVDNYGIDPAMVLDPAHYKEFADTVFMAGQYESYIDYMVAEGRLQ